MVPCRPSDPAKSNGRLRLQAAGDPCSLEMVQESPDLSYAIVGHRTLQCEPGSTVAIIAKIEPLLGLQIDEQSWGGRVDTELNERDNIVRPMAADRIGFAKLTRMAFDGIDLWPLRG